MHTIAVPGIYSNASKFNFRRRQKHAGDMRVQQAGERSVAYRFFWRGDQSAEAVPRRKDSFLSCCVVLAVAARWSVGRNQSPVCGPHERVLWSARCD